MFSSTKWFILVLMITNVVPMTAALAADGKGIDYLACDCPKETVGDLYAREWKILYELLSMPDERKLRHRSYAGAGGTYYI